MAIPTKRVVVDTNVIISAIIFRGPLSKIIDAILDKRITAVTSTMLIAELMDVLNKKFSSHRSAAGLIRKQIHEHWEIIDPKIEVHILDDEPDNRVLEAAMAGQAECIVTGDKQFLKLGNFEGVKIIMPVQLLNELDHEK